VGQPVLWQVANAATRHPFGIIGSDWSSYVVSADVMVPQSGSAGLIGRYRAVNAAQGTFDGYVFDVNTNGTYTLTVNNGGTAAYTQSGQRQLTAPRRTVLAQGKVPRGKVARGKAPFAAGTWHHLSLSVSGSDVVASIDGTQVAMASDSTLTDGMPGVEVGGWYPAYFSNLSVSLPPP
jgi:3-keto-disaccharide hydrolase